MRKVMGFTLIELMVSMAIGLLLLLSSMGFLLTLSKNSHKEIIKLELSQDYLEVAGYLRSILGRAIFQPHCLNPEWLQYKATESNHPIAPFIARHERVILHPANSEDLVETTVMLDADQQFSSLILNDYKLKTLADSDLLEIIELVPLVVQNGEIINVDEVKGAIGYLFITDCQSYLLGRYQKSGLNQYKVTSQSESDVQRHLSNQSYIQYYKINRSLIYVSYEKDQHYLIHNFLDGSNHMRFPNVKGFAVQHSEEDWQVLNLNVLMPYLSPTNLKLQALYIRLLNL